MDSARDHERLAQRPVLDGLVEVGLGRLGDVDRHLGGPDVAGGDHLGAMERPDRVDRQVDHGVEGIAVEVQERAELQDDALFELVGLGLEAGPGGTVALEAARRSREVRTS